MKLFTGILFYFLLCWNQASALSDSPKKIYITGNYSVTEALKFIRPTLDEALKKQDIDPKIVDVKFLSHYEAYKAIRNGHLVIGGRPKSTLYASLSYKMPIAIFYSKKIFGEAPWGLNNANDFRQVVKSAIEETHFGELNRPVRVSFGAISGMTKRAIALYTNMSYDRIKQLGENPRIPLTDRNFVYDAIKKDGYDIVAVPFLLDKILFKISKNDPDIGVATIEGKKPDSSDYPLYDHILYVSYNGKNLEKQRAIANALNDPHVKEALGRIGVHLIEDRNKLEKELVQRRPDLYKRLSGLNFTK